MKTNTKWKACEELLKEGIACRITVTGHSMRPLLRSGDVIEIFSYKGSRITVGDIVLAKERLTGRYLVHRILKRYADGSCRLKGDNCEKEDNIFTKPELLGKVMLVGKGMKLLNTWPATKLIALASGGGRNMVKTGIAIRDLIKR